MEENKKELEEAKIGEEEIIDAAGGKNGNFEIWSLDDTENTSRRHRDHDNPFYHDTPWKQK